MRLAVVLLVLFACHRQAAAGPKPDGSPTMAARPGSIGPGVVVDIARGRAFVMGTDGIVAVDVATGRERWRSTAAVLPLVVSDGRVVAVGARREHGGLAVLDGDTGAVAVTCPGPPPPGPHVQVQDGLGVHVGHQGWVVDGSPVVSWTQDTHYSGGMAPTPEMEAASRTHAEGVLRVDVATGCAEAATLPGVALPPALPWRPDDPAGPWPQPGGVQASVGLQRGERGSRLVLHRSTGGRQLPDVVLTREEEEVGAAVTADARAVLLGVRDRRSASANYEWQLVDLGTGERASRGVHPQAPQAVAVVGESLVVVVPGAVVGVDAVGVQRWHVAVRDLAYRGPYPP